MKMLQSKHSALICTHAGTRACTLMHTQGGWRRVWAADKKQKVLERETKQGDTRLSQGLKGFADHPERAF